MSRARVAAWAALAAAVATGTLADRSPVRAPLTLGGYRVLAGDFHVHPFPLSASTLAPWDLALEAKRQGLDLIAVTPHNTVAVGNLPAWLGGAMVIPGEEVHGPRFHMIAVGTRRTVSWRLSAGEAIEEIHAQGGVAIAAHPAYHSWPAFDRASRGRLDGAEVRQPVIFQGAATAWELEKFYRSTTAAAIGSSDYHGLGRIGLCRTYVFAREASAEGVMEALRARRTLVVDGGRVFGDAELARYAGQLPGAPPRPSRWPAAVGIAALAAIVVLPKNAGSEAGMADGDVGATGSRGI